MAMKKEGKGNNDRQTGSRISPDGEKIDIKNLDYKLIKPLIWW